MRNLKGIEKFFIKGWENWDEFSSTLQFFNNKSKLELVKGFVDFDVYLLEIDLEKCTVVFLGDWCGELGDYTHKKIFNITGILI